MTTTNQNINHGYGYRILDPSNDGPMLPTDELWNGFAWCPVVTTRPFDDGITYRREIDVGEGWERVPEDEARLFNQTSRRGIEFSIDYGETWEIAHFPLWSESDYLVFRRRNSATKESIKKAEEEFTKSVERQHAVELRAAVLGFRAGWKAAKGEQ